MPRLITPKEVLPYLRSETRAALAAAERIPQEAARDAWFFVIDQSEIEHKYSGAFHASFVVGLNDEIPPSEIGEVSDDERHERHANQDYFVHPDPGMIEEVLGDADLDDDIVIANEIRYADHADALFGGLLEVRAAQIAEATVAREVAKFNSRSLAASKAAKKSRRRR